MASAEGLARWALEAWFAASANLVPGIGSFYWWKGRIENETEVLVVFKTSESHADELAVFLAAHQPCETPAIARHANVSANPDYEAWIEAETAGRSGAGQRAFAALLAGNSVLDAAIPRVMM
jgi:periplasmic divalent cation tolerance protein